MFQTLQNTVTLGITLVPDGPILVRAQTAGIDPGIADMEFQRTRRKGRRTVFLAGSGLKGVLRSHAERLLRSAGRFVCDPTDVRNDASCGKAKPDHRPPSYPHGGQCPACFTFGSLTLAGRFRIADAYPLDELWDETNHTETRTGVGIDRKAQAARTNVLFDTEVVVGGGFRVQVQGENFTLWQLGLMFATLQDLGSGLIRVGGCKARGMGAVELRDWSVELRFLDREKGSLSGARQVGGDGKNYGLPPGDSLRIVEAEERQEGLFRTVVYRDPESITALAGALIEEKLRRGYLGDSL